MFLSRLLDLLREAGRQQLVKIDDEARSDALWCVAFLEAFNGITLAKPEVAEFTAFVDSCLVGAGGHCENHGYYSTSYPECIRACGFSISSLECYNLLVAIRLWASDWAGHHVLIFCDNAATVCAMNSGRAEDPLIRAALREAWWLTAVNDIQLVVRHRPGADMEVADLLSRAQTSKAFHKKFAAFASSTDERERHITSNMLMPPLHL